MQPEKETAPAAQPPIDEFASSLLEESKRFLEKANDEEGDPAATNAYLHASLLLAFSALEAHVNAICDDFVSRPELTPQEMAVLQEREVRLVKGRFQLQSALKIFRLEERIEFLHTRFSGLSIDYSSQWWSRLAEATKLRNKLTHPKSNVIINSDSVGNALQAVIDTLDAMYRAIYKSGFPAANLRLNSELTF
jgi:hypothetical protein